MWPIISYYILGTMFIRNTDLENLKPEIVWHSGIILLFIAKEPEFKLHF
jgi:hypothetical protein